MQKTIEYRDGTLINIGILGYLFHFLSGHGHKMFIKEMNHQLALFIRQLDCELL